MKQKLWSVREESLRNELKKIRKQAKLSQNDLALKIGKPQSFVSKYENGERQLKILELEVVCYACNTTAHDFLKYFSELHIRSLN